MHFQTNVLIFFIFWPKKSHFKFVSLKIAPFQLEETVLKIKNKMDFFEKISSYPQLALAMHMKVQFDVSRVTSRDRSERRGERAIAVAVECRLSFPPPTSGGGSNGFPGPTGDTPAAGEDTEAPNTNPFREFLLCRQVCENEGWQRVQWLWKSFFLFPL